jgi:hypothetical protein
MGNVGSLNREVVDFLRTSNLGSINGEPLTSLLITLQPRYQGEENLLYGQFSKSLLEALIRKYYQCNNLKNHSYLNPDSNFRRVFKRRLRKSIEEDITGGDSQELINDYLKAIDDPSVDIEFKENKTNPNKLSLEDLNRLFLDSRDSDSVNLSQLNRYTQRVLGKNYDQLMTDEEDLVNRSKCSQFVYDPITLDMVPNIFGSGLVSRFEATDKILVKSPNQVFLIYLANKHIPYAVIARYDPVTNQLLPPV